MLHAQVSAPLLIGRAPEMQALLALLEAAGNGTGAVAVVGGDAGIGKTRLVRELKYAAAKRQMRVIEGRCSPAEASVPYGPFVDALRFRIGRGEGEEAARVLAPILAHVAPLFSALGDAAAQANAVDAPATAVPFEQIFGVLQRLAAYGPVLFIVEDVHWADSTSRDLLHYIARRITTLPMLLIVTYRTDEIHPGHPVHRLIAALARERTALRVQLEPLRPEEVAELLAALLGDAPDAEFAQAVYARTEGNPLFVEELIGGLLEALPERAPHFRAEDLAGTAAPTTLHEAVWERLGPLSGDARDALTVAAVVGRRFRFDVLAAALDWSEERLLRAVEQLVAHRLIEESDDTMGEAFTFHHSLVQEVLYASTIGRRRRVWHRRVAAALEGVGRTDALPHTTLAHHFELGGDPEKARVHMVLAGDEAARLCAWKEAESMYEAALAKLEREGGDPAAEADILERMAEVAWWQNRLSALEQYSGEALAIRRTLGDRPRAAMLLRRLANLDAYQRGAVDRAMRALHEALELLADEDVDRSVVLNDLGRLHLLRGEYERAGALLEESLAFSVHRGDCSEEALSLVMLGWIAIHCAEIAKGISRLDLARALLAEEAVPIERAAQVFHAGIRALEAAREHLPARDWVEAAIAYAREHGARGDLAVYRAYQAAVQRRAGEWAPALEVAAAAVEELRASGRAELREALRILGDLQRVRGELDAARASYEEAQRLGESAAAIGHAMLLLAEHRCAEAAERLAAALEQQPESDRLFALRVLPVLVEAHAGAGDLPAARAALARVRALLRESDYRAGPAALAHAAGTVHAAAGDKRAAARELRHAAEEWRSLELPYEAARATLLLAAQLVGGDAHDEGVELAAQAARSFEALGASLELARAHQLLRDVGVRVRRARRAETELPEPLCRLTPREAEVLSEIARGRTNKQIARTLSMSPRTVGNHVSAILTKLGCATRTEASRVALEARGAGG